MGNLRRFRPSPALAISAIALFAAIGGVAVALPGHNSVRSDDIKNGQVKSPDLKNNDVKGIDVRESSLGTVPNANHANSADNATSATNATHATTADSLSGSALNLTTRVVTQSAPVTGTFAGTDVTAPCQAGEVATGGGGLINNDDNEVTYQASHPSPGANGSTPTGWTVRFQVTGIPHNVTVYAVCASP